MTAGRFPWGAGPAPALRCDECARRIGKTNTHLVTPDRGNLFCVRCWMGPRSTQARLHARLYPDCPHTWHDLGDHHVGHATRAGAWFALHDPEKRKA